MQLDQQQNILRRRMEENASLSHRLKTLEGKQAHVLSTRALSNRFGKSARAKLAKAGITITTSTDENAINNSASPSRVLRLRSHALNNFSPAKANNMPFSSPLSVISRWNASTDTQTESIKTALNNEVKIALKK